ncbi:MAG: HAMP domain-containing protein [Planctomycetes bacterium]|nr:HAMP domain-containing protein [Planctomycetota bacterium]
MIASRNHNSATSNPPPWMRWTIGRKLGLAFASVALLLLAIGAVVWVEVHRMNAALADLLEEQVESQYSQQLLRGLQVLDQSIRVMGSGGAVDGAGVAQVLTSPLEESLRALSILRQGTHGIPEPMTEHASHEEREQKLYARIENALRQVQESSKSASDLQSARATVQEALHDTESLHGEMARRVAASGSEVRADAAQLRRLVFWTTAAGLACIAGLLYVLTRTIVRPVLALRAAAAELEHGGRAPRLAAAGGDEIAELSADFNSMAAEVESTREDLQKRVEERTREFLRAAKLASLGTLAAGVAHEINNPLASIASCAEGLDRRLRTGKTTTEEQLEYLRIIGREAYRAHEITSRLLDFARQDAGEKHPFDPKELFAEVKKLLGHTLEKQGLKLEIECDPNLPRILGNPNECRQVILNLLQNAIDATPPGKTIRIQCRRAEKAVMLTVEDEGTGIPPEHLDRIFDPFFTTKEPGKGTGLGLAIVHRIVVDGHGGRIEAENTGHGARFRVTIPSAEEIS